MPVREFSVLIPLSDCRGSGDESLAQWMGGQTFPRQRYELILLATGEDPDLESRWRARCASHDVWLDVSTRDEWELYNVGARYATAEYLFLTEAHCVPEPDCLEGMHAHLVVFRGPGARGRTVARTLGSLGDLEWAMFEQGLTAGEDPTHWDKILNHSFAISAHLFRSLGEFDPGYGSFAPHALAVELWRRGHRLGFASGSRVHHTFTGDIATVVGHVVSFSWGRARFHATAVDRAASYVPESREWARRFTYARYPRRAFARALVRTPRGSWGSPVAVVEACLTLLCGPRALLVASRLRLTLARLRLRIARDRDDRMLRFRQMWAAAERHGAARWLAAHPPADDVRTEPRLEYELTGPRAPAFVGFSVVEEWNGIPFRWTGRASVVHVHLPEGEDLEGRIELLPLKRIPPRVTLTLDGRRIAADEVHVEPGAIRFPVRGTGLSWLGLRCDVSTEREDVEPRELGLPITAIRFERTEDVELSPDPVFGRVVLGGGWEPPEEHNGRRFRWIGADRKAWLDLELNGAGDRDLEIDVPHAMSRAVLAGTRVLVNGRRVALRFRDSADGVELSGRVPSGVAGRRGRRLRVEVRVPSTLRPCDVDPASPDTRNLGIAVSAVRLGVPTHSV